jgi:hypothetical protein
MMLTHEAVRRVSQARPGISTGCMVIGIQTSTSFPTVSPKNSGGATPITVTTASSCFGAFGASGSNPLVPPPACPPRNRSVRPRTAGDPANARCHSPWLITATGPAPAARSSSGMIARPAIG